MALIRSTAVIGINTLLSRVLGYVRDILTARELGTSPIMEAFVVAWRFPNLFRRLVAEGAFAAAFVPMYAKRFEKVLPATKVLRFVQIENKLDTLIEMQAVRAIPLAQP